MEFAAKIFGGTILVLGGLFLMVILGTLMGAISGWIVGLFFSDTILGVWSKFGISGFTMWELGAFLGFTGGFFRASQTNNSK